jgi:hypothetical protein
MKVGAAEYFDAFDGHTSNSVCVGGLRRLPDEVNMEDRLLLIAILSFSLRKQRRSQIRLEQYFPKTKQARHGIEYL